MVSPAFLSPVPDLREPAQVLQSIARWQCKFVVGRFLMFGFDKQ